MSVRVCFEFRVQPHRLDEYLRRHDPVEPDMLDALHRAGIRDYSLFLAEDGRVIGTYRTDDPAATDAALADSPAARAWDELMRPMFAADPETGAVSRPLREVFHLETQRETAPRDDR